LDYMYALAEYYLKRQKFQRAKKVAETMVKKHPGQRIGHDLLNLIEGKLQETR
jgi:hypothetical protein